jgi:hypothetical protein
MGAQKKRLRVDGESLRLPAQAALRLELVPLVGMWFLLLPMPAAIVFARACGPAWSSPC